MNRTLVIAHRGAHNRHIRENTLESFQRAIDIGADMIECDVRRTLDGRLVIFHDRQTGGHRLDGITYRELNRLAGRQGFRVPELQDLLEIARGRIRLDIELKETGYEEETVRALLSKIKPSDFVMTSFKRASLIRIKSGHPRVRTGLLVGPHRLKYILGMYSPGNLMVVNGRRITDFLGIHYQILNPMFLIRAGSYNAPVYAWTVNSVSGIHELMEYGVEGLITDRADKALELKHGHISGYRLRPAGRSSKSIRTI